MTRLLKPKLPQLGRHSCELSAACVRRGSLKRPQRLIETAGGGEVVLSATTAEVVPHQVPEGQCSLTRA